jgi:hypothetical protein
MSAVNYTVPHISMFGLPQDSPVTCWAACAAMLAACRLGRERTEGQVLSEPWLTAWRNQRAVSPEEISTCYTGLGYQQGSIPTGSARACADFIIAHAPIIVCSAIVRFSGGATLHQGYHVRVIYGCAGDPDTGTPGDFQVLIYDPCPQDGFMYMQGYLWQHFSYQMNLRTGPRPEIVGRCWNYR